MKTKLNKKEKPTQDRTKKLLRFNNLKLAGKIAVIASAMLIVVFTCLMVFTILSTIRTTKGTINDGFKMQSSNTANQIQGIIDTASLTAQSLTDYLEDAYGKSGSSDGSAMEKSTVYDVQMTQLSRDVEKFIIGTSKNTVKNNTDIVGIGTFFEPYAFDKSIKDYTIYIGTQDIESDNVQSYGTYETYAQEEYYAVARDSQEVFVTSPYEDQGVLMVTISYPIVFDGKVQGVIAVDIGVDNFSRVDIKNDKYPSMYTTIYDQKTIIVYDTATGDITQPMAKFFSDDKEYEATLEKQEEGKAFSIETTREDGRKIMRFFQPIQCGNYTWWAMTALYTQEMLKEVSDISLWLIVISIAALVLIVTVLRIILKRMLKPIDNVLSAARQIAEGDLNVDLQSNTNDEIGQLSNAFNQTAQGLKLIIGDTDYLLTEMSNGNFNVHSRATDKYIGEFYNLLTSIRKINHQLSDTLAQIHTASEQVASGSDQVSGGAQALSQGTTEQASSIEELAATINDISQHVSKTAENSKLASEVSAKSGEQVEICNEQMRTMVSSMAEITESSNEIGKIIKTIEDIAFQTNILALNAAVEAARAGEAGKGFAVVADEVRNLAGKSAEAASNTTALIEGAIQAVSGGTKIVDETAESLNKVVESTHQVGELVADISQATSEQAESITQITNGIDQISSVIQTNSATAEESAAASEELSGQSQLLKDLVGKFTLRE